MKTLKLHSTLLIFLLLLFHENGTHARFSFKNAMKKIGGLAKAALATGLAIAAKSLPIPLSLLPGGKQLQEKLGAGISIGGVDLAAAAADPKAAARQMAMKKAQQATGVDVNALNQMRQGGNLGPIDTANIPNTGLIPKTGRGAKRGSTTGGRTPQGRPPPKGQPPLQRQQALRQLFVQPTENRALPLPFQQPTPQPPAYPQPQYANAPQQYANAPPSPQNANAPQQYTNAPPQYGYAPPPPQYGYAPPVPMQYYGSAPPSPPQQQMQQQQPVYANQPQQQPTFYAQ